MRTRGSYWLAGALTAWAVACSTDPGAVVDPSAGGGPPASAPADGGAPTVVAPGYAGDAGSSARPTPSVDAGTGDGSLHESGAGDAGAAVDTPTFVDYFTSLDPNRWLTSYGGTLHTLADNKEWEYYADSAVSTGPGGLVLTATKGVPNPLGLPCVSGMVQENSAFARSSGFWEAVMKLSAGAGFWPAFWFLARSPT